MLNKNIFTVIVLLFFSLTSNAQVKMGAEFGVLFPRIQYGNLISNYTGGVNFGVSARYYVHKQVGCILSSGYYRLKGVVGNYEYKKNITPILLSFEFILLKNKLSPYLGFGMGIFFIKNESDNSTYDYQNYKESTAGITPFTGLRYSFSDKAALDLNIKYLFVFEEYGTIGILNSNIGFIYSFH